MGEAFKSDSLSAVADPENMAARVMKFSPATDAEALKLLRARFPDCPLSMRIAALNVIMRRRQRGFGQSL
jgi:hypothetical protein